MASDTRANCTWLTYTPVRWHTTFLTIMQKPELEIRYLGCKKTPSLVLQIYQQEKNHVPWTTPVEKTQEAICKQYIEIADQALLPFSTQAPCCGGQKDLAGSCLRC